MTREQFLENLVTVMHRAIVEQQADVLFTDEVWQNISDVSKIEHPYKATAAPYEPTEEDLASLDQIAKP